MNVLETTQHLVDEVLHVVHRKLLLAVDDAMKVCLHEISHDVHIVVVLRTFHIGRHHVDDLDDVVVTKMPQELDLAQDAFGINFVLKGFGYHLDGDIILRLGILSGDDNSVGTRSDGSNHFVALVDGKRVLARRKGVSLVGWLTTAGSSEEQVSASGSTGRAHDNFHTDFAGDRDVALIGGVRDGRCSSGPERVMIVVVVVMMFDHLGPRRLLRHRTLAEGREGLVDATGLQTTRDFLGPLGEAGTEGFFGQCFVAAARAACLL